MSKAPGQIWVTEQPSTTRMGACHSYKLTDATEFIRADLCADPALLAEAVEVLRWYGEQSRLARLIHSEGDAGRHAIDADGGNRARAFIAKWEARHE